MRSLVVLALLLSSCRPPSTDVVPPENPVAAFYSVPADSSDTAHTVFPGRVYLNWTNKIARPVGEGGEEPNAHAFTLEEFEAIKGADLYCFSGRAVFYQEHGLDQARRAAGEAPIVAYVTVLHTHLPEYYENNRAWEWYNQTGELFSGTHMLNIMGEPATRWRTKDPAYDTYHQDDNKTNPEDYARLIVQAVREYPVDGLLLDYLDTGPWTYPEDPPLAVPEDDWQSWRDYQIRLVAELRKLMGPDFLIIANGRWAMAEPRWVQSWLLSGVFWERMGTLWWTPERVQELAADRPGLQLFDPRQGTKQPAGFSVRDFAEQMAEQEQCLYVHSR